MENLPEGNAIVYCEGAYNTTNGKTAHGLIRRTKRYTILSVVDSNFTGRDAGTVLDGKANGIPVFATISDAFRSSSLGSETATHVVVGLAPDGGRMSGKSKGDLKEAVSLGLNIDCGLHDFLSEDHEFMRLAEKHRVKIRDIRKTPPRNQLHFFCSKIEQVTSLKVALLGTDSAIGKRTSAWLLVDALNNSGYKAELVGTGQTAWMQGAQYSVILDSLINDFVSGEIEHAVWSACKHENPDVIVIEGQGSLMNPAYPGGFEILAAGRPDVVILQHAPARKEYDGFPGYPLHSLDKQIQAIEMISGIPVVAITINHEKLQTEKIPAVCTEITAKTGLPACDPLVEGIDKIVNVLKKNIFTDKLL